MNKITFAKLKKMRMDILPISELRRKDDADSYEVFTKTISRKQILQIIDNAIGKRNIALIPNEFPYTNITTAIPHLVHYCLWSRKGELSDAQIKRQIEKKFPNKEYVYFERDLSYRSIPEIKHYHVFIKLK